MPITLDVRLDGFDQPIGHLFGDDRGGVAFAYRPDYLGRPDAMAISMSLPLSETGYGDPPTRAYFDNLLQERDTARADIIAKYDIANDDIAGILLHLGKDCSGAISVLPEGAPATKVPGDLLADYVPLADDRLIAIIRSLHERRALPADVQDPSPLAGVQSKIAVTRLPDGRFAEPREGSGAPTTHILKVPDDRHRRDALHEHAAMALSLSFGFPTASTSVVEIGGISVLAVERFDRKIDQDGRIIRRHQEDFCQAMGLPARQKYERRGIEGRRFDAVAVGQLLDQTIDPAVEKRRFVEETFFDLLIGNVDGHAKNFSIFHLPGNRIRSTPRYDVMPTMLDRGTTDEFAYRIGNAEVLNALSWDAVDDFLAALGFSSRAGRRRLASDIVPSTVRRLNEKIEGIAAEYLKDFSDLLATNIRTICRRLEIEIPTPAGHRDTFVR